MTEAEWLACTEPERMLAYLQRKAGDRKFRLFACGVCRQHWDQIFEQDSRRAVEIAEAFADGKARIKDLQRAEEAAELAIGHAFQRAGDDFRQKPWEERRKLLTDDCEAEFVDMILDEYRLLDQKMAGMYASWAKGCACSRGGWGAARLVCNQGEGVITKEDQRTQVIVLCDLFGNPFRPVAAAKTWLTWNDATIPKLAQVIYTDRTFHRLPILADALEDAGCDNADILAHCRSCGEHVRGCWVVDLILGKQ